MPAVFVFISTLYVYIYDDDWGGGGERKPVSSTFSFYISQLFFFQKYHSKTFSIFHGRRIYVDIEPAKEV